MDCDSSNDSILRKSKLFLANRKNSNELVEILNDFEDITVVTPSHVLAVRMIFVEVLRKSQLSFDIGKGNKEYIYKEWLKGCFNQALRKLLDTLQIGNPEIQLQALQALFAIRNEEEKSVKLVDEDFADDRLKTILKKLVTSPRCISHLMLTLSEHTSLPGMTASVWRALDRFTKEETKPSQQTVRNVLLLIGQLPKDKAVETMLKKRKGNDSTSTEQAAAASISGNSYRVWQWLSKHNSHGNLKQLLIALLENFIPVMSNLIFLTDFLVDALNSEGAVSLLALQGIYILVQKCNIDYPNIYGKLYTMLKPEIFRLKYKARFFYLLDLFLSSTHLPEQLVASFAKRLSRLALIAPPHDILILLPFVGNLLIRHPNLKRLINQPNGANVEDDPFIMEEKDPYKTKALESSLWEIKSLQRHILPAVSKWALFIESPLPSVEWDLSERLERTADQMFDREKKGKLKDLSITFERPTSLSVPRQLNIEDLWNL